MLKNLSELTYTLFDLIRVFLIFLLLLVLIPNSMNGFADIENKNIIAKTMNEEVILSLLFGENQYSNFDRIIPTLQSGSLVLGDRILEIENARVKNMGNSFVVHSNNILIYSKGLGSENYLINCYLIGGSKLEAIKLFSVQQNDFSEEIEDNSPNIDMIVLVQQDTRTFWNDTYDLEIKVFNKSINPHPQFYQSLGAIDQADVTMIIKNSNGAELKQFTGKTNSKGFWNMSYFVPQNIVPGGTYTVELSVDYLGSKNFQSFETFIVSDTRNTDSSN